MNEKIYENDLVSIIMPSYNSGKYIVDSIDSVINQTYTNWELIVVNDCSNDNSIDILNVYAIKDKRIKIFSNDVNKGVAFSRNFAISKASGRFIAFLDADDIWFNNKLELQLSFMKEKNVGFSFTAYKIFNDENDLNLIFNVPKQIDYNSYLKNTIIGNLTVILDRNIIENIHVEYGELEDVLTWMHFLKKGYIAYGLNIPLAKYRVYKNSRSGNKFRNALRYYDCLRHYQNLSLIKSIYCEFWYAYNAIYKRLKRENNFYIL